jgi:hypothetical protein
MSKTKHKKVIEAIKEHPRNEFISFNEKEHTYHYSCGDRNEYFGGVTSLIGNYTKPFDPSIASYIAYRDGITEQAVLDSWDRARNYGNYVDFVIGNYINGVDMDVPEVKMFKRAMAEKKLTPVISEWIVYDEEINTASGIDVVAVDEEGKLVIIDLKSMEKDIKYHGYKGAKMSYPLETLEDSKYYKQALQVGLYRYWIEKHYDLPISNQKYVLRIRPTFYEWIPLIPVELEIEKLYKFENEN